MRIIHVFASRCLSAPPFLCIKVLCSYQMKLNFECWTFSSQLLCLFNRRFWSFCFCFRFYFYSFFFFSLLLLKINYGICLTCFAFGLVSFVCFVCLLLLSSSMFMFNYPLNGRGLFIYFSLFSCSFSFRSLPSLFITEQNVRKKNLNGNFLKRIITSI